MNARSNRSALIFLASGSMWLMDSAISGLTACVFDLELDQVTRFSWTIPASGSVFLIEKGMSLFSVDSANKSVIVILSSYWSGLINLSAVCRLSLEA